MFSAKLPLSILTDFEEFAVYDTRIKPDKNDKASVASINPKDKFFEKAYNGYNIQRRQILQQFSLGGF